MQQELPISTIIQIAKVCQYLAVLKKNTADAFNGNYLDRNLSRTIYMERKAVEWAYTYTPTDPTLRGSANYLFSLLKYSAQAQNIINGISAGKPVVTGPSNQSVGVGDSATFAIAITSTTPVTIQWYKNGLPIAGAVTSSYTLTNAQLSDSGDTFYASVTNAAGTVFSQTATLTITAGLTGFFAYLDSNPGPTLQGGNDPFTYQEGFSITAGQPWIMAVPSASTPTKYIIVKGPSSESTKTAWNNAGVNVGFIPDLNWESSLVIGSERYYYTRGPISLDPLNTLTLS